MRTTNPAMIVMAVLTLASIIPAMAQLSYTLPKKFDGSQSIPPASRTLTDPMNCNGWLEKRIFMESQSWFTRPGDDVEQNSSHLHIGACLPHTQRVAGVIPLDLLVQKHQMPDMNVGVSIEVFFQWTGGNTTIRLTQAKSINNFTCGPTEQVVCKRVISAWVETVNQKWKIPDGVNRMSIKAKLSFNDGLSTRSMSTELLSWVIVANQDPGNSITQTKWPLTQNSLTGFPWSYVHASFDGNSLFNPIEPWTNTTAPLKLRMHHVSDANIANVTGIFATKNPVFHKDPLPPVLGDVNIDDDGYVIADVDPYYTKYEIEGITKFFNASAPINKKYGCSTSRNHTNCYTDYFIPLNNLTDGFHKLMFRTNSFHPIDEPVLKAFNDNKLASGGVPVNGGTFSAISLFQVATNNDGTFPGWTLSESGDGGVTYPPPVAPTNDTWYMKHDGTSAVQINPHLPTFNAATKLPPWENMLDGKNYHKCLGWEEIGLKMRYIEAQSWFTKPVDVATGLPTSDKNATTVEGNLEMDSTHLHIGACMPHGQRVAGTIPLDLLINKHNFGPQQNATVSIKVEFEWSGGNTTFKLTQSNSIGGWQCSNQVDCKKVLPVWIATQANGYVIPNGLHKMRVEALLSLNDGMSTRGFSARAESWVIIANNAVNISTATKQIVSSTAKTDFPWSYTHANLVEDPYAKEYWQGTVNFASKHFIETTVSNITGVFNTVNPRFHMMDNVTMTQLPPDLGKLLVNFSDHKNYLSPNVPTYCTKVNGHVDCNNVVNGYNTIDTGDGFQKIFMRTDSFVANQDPTLFAFNMEKTPGKNGGTFSSVTLFTVKVNATADAGSALVGRKMLGRPDGLPEPAPEFSSSSLGNPPLGSERVPIMAELESHNGEGIKPVIGKPAVTNEPRNWVKGQKISWAESMKGGDYVGSSTRPYAGKGSQ